MSASSNTYFLRGLDSKIRTEKKKREIVENTIRALSWVPNQRQYWKHIELYSIGEKIALRLRKQSHFIEEFGDNGLKIFKSIKENRGIPYNKE